MKTDNNQLNDKIDIPKQMTKELKLSPEKAQMLFQILYELLEEESYE